MQVDPEAQKKLLTDLIENLRKLDSELLVYRYVVFLVQQGGLAPLVPWDALIAAARTNPALENIMSQKYDPLVQHLIRTIDEAEFESQLREFLRSWKPSDLPN